MIFSPTDKKFVDHEVTLELTESNKLANKDLTFLPENIGQPRYLKGLVFFRNPVMNSFQFVGTFGEI